MPHGHTHDDHHPTHAHGHAHDQGLAGFLRYASMLPRMWKSDVSEAVVALVNPKPGERVIEIGAGMGAAMVPAARTGAHVTAVDPTPYMRRILRVRSLAHGGPWRISVCDGAAEHLPIADASADAVFTVNTMHHWSDLDRALFEIRRVLRPGGRVVLVDEDFENPAHPSHEQFARRRARHGHSFDEVDPAKMAVLLRSLAFTSATGSLELVAGMLAKVVRATRA